MRDLGQRIVAAGLAAVLAALRALPLDAASWLGGAAARGIGPRSGRHRLAERNLKLAMPELDAGARARVLRGMWDNLGRTLGELAHLAEFDCRGGDGRVEVVGGEHLARMRDDGIGGIAFSAHLGWWDLAALALNQSGLDARMVYREENNPHVRAKMLRVRAAAGAYLPKGTGAARDIVAGLKAGHHYGMLLDQKMNDGIAVPFFGIEAMTAPAAAQFAVRDGIPLLPVRCERLIGARFRITFDPPMVAETTGDRAADVAATARRINATLEEWIRARPEQWLWIHRRWPDGAVRET